MCLVTGWESTFWRRETFWQLIPQRQIDSNTPNGLDPHQEEAAPDFSHDVLIYNRKKSGWKSSAGLPPRRMQSLSLKISQEVVPAADNWHLEALCVTSKCHKETKWRRRCCCGKRQAILFLGEAWMAEGVLSKCLLWTIGFSVCRKGCSLSSSPFFPLRPHAASPGFKGRRWKWREMEKWKGHIFSPILYAGHLFHIPSHCFFTKKRLQPHCILLIREGASSVNLPLKAEHRGERFYWQKTE